MQSSTLMQKTLGYLFLTIVCISCNRGIGIRKSKMDAIDRNFSGIFKNDPFHTKGRRYGIVSLMQSVGVTDISSDSVGISFDDSDRLHIVYGDSLQKHLILTGSFTGSNYYEYFFSNQSKGFPPYVPFIYSVNHISRIRIGVSINGYLVVDDVWDESGHILILGAGDSGRRQSFFARLQ